MQTFSAIRVVVRVVRDKYGLSTLRRPLLWSYQCFYMIGFHRDDLLKLGSTQSEKQKNIINLVGKIFIFVDRNVSVTSKLLLSLYFVCAFMRLHKIGFYERKAL